MKKIFGRLGGIMLLVLAVFSCCLLFACSPSLSRPPKLSINFNTIELEWSPVPNATAYMIEIDGKEYASSRTTYSLAFLSEGEHKIRVRARDASNTYGDSDWSDTLRFYKEYESGLSYTLINANTEYQLVSMGSATGDVVIEDEYRGKPVTVIAQSAFKSKPSLTSLVIGKNVKTIGAQAFFNCSNLASVTIPEGVTSIGESAFQGCRALTSVVIPDTVTEIADNTFRFCRNLKSVAIGGNVKTVGQFAFYDCDKLEELELPSSVTAVEEGAFSGDDNLASVELGSGVKSLGKNAFASCTSLTKITGGAALTTIGETAFTNCDSLETFTAPSSVTTIGRGAFSGDDKLESVGLGDSVQSIGFQAFDNTPLYRENVKDGIIYADNWAIGYTEGLADISFKTGVAGIADGAFSRSEISSVAFPSTVKYIGASAFYNCDSLIALDLGDGVVTLGEYAFAECDKLGRGQVSLGTSVKTIGNYAFNNCADFGNTAYLLNFTVPRSVDVIGVYAFRNTYFWKNTESGVVYVGDWAVGYKDDEQNTNISLRDGTYGISNYAFYKSKTLTAITIPETVRIIGANAFNGCAELARVFIDEFCRITEIRDYTFYKCAKLRGVDIPVDVEKIGRSAFYKSGIVEAEISEWVTDIGPYAYYGCTDLVAVSIPANAKLESIGSNAFAGCTALADIELPSSLVSLGERVFSRCSALNSVTFGENSALTEISDYAFYNCGALKSVNMPAGLESVGNRAFYKCTALNAVTFGGSEQKIGDYAFYGCAALTQIELPSTLKTLGSHAFRKCTGLTAVILANNIEAIGDHAFNGCRYLTLYVQSDRAAAGWSARWNSGYRPVVWGVAVSDGNVTSFTYSAAAIDNINAVNGISPPVRDDYVVVGWKAAGSDALITDLTAISGVANGATLTAVWDKKPAPSPSEEEDQPTDEQ